MRRRNLPASRERLRSYGERSGEGTFSNEQHLSGGFNSGLLLCLNQTKQCIFSKLIGRNLNENALSFNFPWEAFALSVKVVRTDFTASGMTLRYLP